jgi:hypothetical protein
MAALLLLVAVTAAAPSPTRLVIPAVPAPGSAEQEQPRPAEASAPCPISREGPPATLRVRTETGCGGSSAACVTSQRLEIEVPGAEERPFSFGRNVGEREGERPRIDVTCEPGRLAFVPLSGKPVVFAVDAGGTRMDLDPAVGTELEALWNEPPGAARARRVAEIKEVLEDLSRVGPGGPAVHLLQAREELAAGRLAAFEETIRSSHCAAAEDPAASRCKALVAERTALGERTQPVRLVGGKRLGVVSGWPSLPFTLPEPPDATATRPEIFWRSRALCVGQEDGSGTMRCYDVERGRWGAREPLVPRSGRPTLGYFMWNRQTCTAEEGEEVDGPCYGCDGCWGIASVPQRRMILRIDRKLHLVARAPEPEKPPVARPISAPEATALLATSGGSVLCGGARLEFGVGNELHELANPQQRWHPLPALQGGEEWSTHVEPLVSPDQRHVVAFTQPASGKMAPGALWLFRIEPNPH